MKTSKNDQYLVEKSKNSSYILLHTDMFCNWNDFQCQMALFEIYEI